MQAFSSLQSDHQLSSYSYNSSSIIEEPRNHKEFSQKYVFPLCSALSSTILLQFHTICFVPCRCCSCNCHGVDTPIAPKPKSKSVNSRLAVAERKSGRVDEGSQTLSTGDIVITKIFFKEDQDKGPEKVILSSTNKVAQ